MNKHRSLPTFLFALFSLVIIFTGPVSAASPAEDAVAGWMQSVKDLGASVASYDGIIIDEAADTATIENVQIEFEFPTAEEGKPFAIALHAGNIVLVGFRKDENGYHIARYSISEDNSITLSGEGKQGAPFLMEGALSGAFAEGVYYPKFVAIPEDLDHPVSRYLKFYDLYFKKMIVEKSGIDKIVLKQLVDGKPFLNMEYNGLTTKGMAGGRIEEMRINSYKQEFSLPDEAGDVPFKKVTSSYGLIIQSGIDLNPLVAAIKGSGAGKGGEYQTIFGVSSVSDVNIEAGPVTVTVDNYKIEDVAIRPGQKSLVALLDKLVSGVEMDDKEVLPVVADFFSGFSLGELSISNVAGSGPSNVTGKLDKFIISEVSGKGLGEFSIKGVDVSGPDGEKISLDYATVAKVLFPSLEKILDAMENGTPQDPIKAAELAPKVGEFEVSKLYVDTKKNPVVSLGLFSVLQSDFVGPIPTNIKIEAQDLDLPVAYIPNPAAQVLLSSLGYDVLGMAAKVVLKWYESTQDLILENADISLENGANIHIKAGLAGFPRSVIQNPKNFMGALVSLAFKNFNLEIKDAIIVPGIIEHFARLQNMSPEKFSRLIVRLIETQSGPLTGTPFIEELKAAVAQFLIDPKRLSIDIVPAAPVPFTQILGTVSTTPDQMPDLLGATVSAN